MVERKTQQTCPLQWLASKIRLTPLNNIATGCINLQNLALFSANSYGYHETSWTIGTAIPNRHHVNGPILTFGRDSILVREMQNARPNGRAFATILCLYRSAVFEDHIKINAAVIQPRSRHRVAWCRHDDLT